MILLFNFEAITKCMAENTLPDEFKSFPMNFLYGFYKFYIAHLENQCGKSIAYGLVSRKNIFGEYFTFKDGNERITEYVTITYERNVESGNFSLRLYKRDSMKKPHPNFEKDRGFDRIHYNYPELLVVEWQPGENSRKIMAYHEAEKAMVLNTELYTEFKTHFQTTTFLGEFYTTYKVMMMKQFANLSIH